MEEKRKNELARPALAKVEGAFEVLRVWIGPESHEIVLNTTWPDPGAWGVLLVDIARQVARAFGEEGKPTEQEALARIRELFDMEWQTPTTESEGE